MRRIQIAGVTIGILMFGTLGVLSSVTEATPPPSPLRPVAGPLVVPLLSPSSMLGWFASIDDPQTTSPMDINTFLTWAPVSDPVGTLLAQKVSNIHDIEGSWQVSADIEGIGVALHAIGGTNRFAFTLPSSKPILIRSSSFEAIKRRGGPRVAWHGTGRIDGIGGLARAVYVEDRLSLSIASEYQTLIVRGNPDDKLFVFLVNGGRMGEGSDCGTDID